MPELEELEEPQEAKEPQTALHVYLTPEPGGYNDQKMATYVVGEHPEQAPNKGQWFRVLAQDEPTYDEFTQSKVAGGWFTAEDGTAIQTWVITDRPIEELKNKLHGMRRSLFDSQVAAGFLVDTLHVRIDDKGLARLQSMALTAFMSQQMLVDWPTSYSDGWVSIEGDKIPLPTPQDGINLMHDASSYYASLVHAKQDLESTINALTTADAAITVRSTIEE